MREFIAGSIPVAAFLAISGCASTATSGSPKAGLGIMVGEVTPNSALVQVRLSTTDTLVSARVDGESGVKRDVPGIAGVVEFRLWAAHGTEPVEIRTIEARAERDFIARASFANLRAATRYECRTRIGPDTDSLQSGPTATFRTLPGAAGARRIAFVVVTGMNYGKFHGDDRIDRKRHLLENNTELPRPYEGPDKHLGYPALASILNLKPDFFVGTGDNVYYDTPKNPRAQTIPELRQKWHEQFVQPRYRELFARVPTYWEVDDHDYRIDDGDNTGDHDPSPAVARRLMLEQLPYAPADAVNPRTYRTHRVSRDLQVWFVENRIYRSPNAMEDGPDKTIWGAEQKAWLKRTLAASDATYKLLISPTPMIGPDDRRKSDNHANFGGFRHERDEFFRWLRESGVAERNFYILCGDRHWQYHSIHPTGIEEFSCGALVDANSRLGRKPGDRLSTDPEGLIRQVYAQTERSAGFLHVQVDPATRGAPTRLTFTWHDELGKVLHRHVK